GPDHRGGRDRARRRARRRLMGVQATPAFRAHASGLIVPEALSRIREVITKDEWKALSKAIQKVLGPRRIKFLFFCDHEGCSAPRVERIRTADGFVLRCGCRDRVYSPSV